MTNPLVSIIIPLYNADRYIEHMINSIINQTYQFWELIIIDDNSNDCSYNIVSDYARQDSRIQIYKKDYHEAKGANCSRNIGLKRARGEYIVFFDADDLISKTCLENRVGFMSKNLEIDFAIFPAMAFKKEPFDVKLIYGYKHSKNILDDLIVGALPFTVWTNIYRRTSLIEKKIKWDEILKSWQDRDFNILTIHKGLTYSICNTAPDYFWRIEGNENSISKNINTLSHLKSRLYFINKWQKNLGKNSYNALLALSDTIFRSILSYPEESFKLFITLDIFKTRKILKHKLKQVYFICQRLRIKNKKIYLLLSLIFFPIYTLRPSCRFKRYRLEQLFLYKQLYLKYHNKCLV